MSEQWIFRKKMPDVIKRHVMQLREGEVSFINGDTVIRSRIGFNFDLFKKSGVLIEGARLISGSNNAEETESNYSVVKRLAESDAMDDIWDIASSFGLNDSELVCLFDSAWEANISYDDHRKTAAGNNRHIQVKELAGDIYKLADRLIEKLLKVDDVWPRHSKPDKNMSSLELLGSLGDLKINAANLRDSSGLESMFVDQFIKEAVASQKANPKLDYARGFLSFLTKRKFSLERPGISMLLAKLANVVMNNNDGGFADKDFMRLIPDFRDKK